MHNVISVMYLLHVRLFIHPSRYRVISTRHGFAISLKFLKLKLWTCWRIHTQVHPDVIYVIPLFRFEISKYCSRTYNHLLLLTPNYLSRLPNCPSCQSSCPMFWGRREKNSALLQLKSAWRSCPMGCQHRQQGY